MALMAVLGAALVAGLTAAVTWLRVPYRPWTPPSLADKTRQPPFRDTAWVGLRGAAIWLVAGIWTGALVTGPAMRLIMRLLAVTAGHEAQGAITEAEQVVGDIDFGETLSLMAFGGLAPGLLSAFIYLVVRRWLPAPPLGGVVFGLLHLLVAATRFDPLRPDNPDFDIVGPGWLAVATFGAAAVLHGVVVSAFVNRYSQALPPARPGRAPLLAALLPLVIAGLFVLPAALVVLVPALVGVTIAALGLQIPPLRRALAGSRVRKVVRVLGAAVALACAPGALLALIDIATR